MGETAADILADELRWMQDRILYAAITELTDNLDSFPVFGFGFAFLKRSAEQAIVNRVKQDIVPDMEAHLDLVVAVIDELAAADDRDAVRDRYDEQLLEQDPLWQLLREEARSDEVRDRILTEKWASLATAADWVAAAGDNTFDSLIEMLEDLGLGREETMAAVENIFFYIEMMDDEREGLDAEEYSSVLSNPRVQDWFLTHLIAGMEAGLHDVINELGRRIDDRDGSKEWKLARHR